MESGLPLFYQIPVLRRLISFSILQQEQYDITYR